MPTKDQLSERVNSLLGTDMEWEKMKKEDLQLLYELLDEGALLEPQAKHIVKKKGKSHLENQVDEWQPGQIALKVLGGV